MLPGVFVLVLVVWGSDAQPSVSVYDPQFNQPSPIGPKDNMPVGNGELVANVCLTSSRHVCLVCVGAGLATTVPEAHGQVRARDVRDVLGVRHGGLTLVPRVGSHPEIMQGEMYKQELHGESVDFH